MPAVVLDRPGPADYGEYYTRYTSCVPAGDLVEIMNDQISTLRDRLEPLGEAEAGFAYAPGKWTLREVIGHLTDTERVFSYRATAFSRGDDQPLPGFDQALWNPYGEYDAHSLADVLGEWISTRAATVALLRSMPAAALQRRGVASGKEITVLACLCIIAGHVHYHIDQLQTHYGVRAVTASNQIEVPS